jgi:hypothetical protein
MLAIPIVPLKIRSYIFRTNKYLLVACRAASASSSKYGLTSSIFYFITFPGSLLGIVQCLVPE